MMLNYREVGKCLQINYYGIVCLAGVDGTLNEAIEHTALLSRCLFDMVVVIL